MVGIIIKAVIGLVLFAGSLVGGLAATGRLNHEGTANIPLLNSFFPEPEKVEGEGEEGKDGEKTKDGAADANHAAPGGETKPADGAHTGETSTAADAAHGEQGPKTKSRSIVGPSVLNPEAPKKDDGHGGGDDGHGGGDDGHGGGGDDAHGADAGGHETAGHEADSHKPDDQGHNKTRAERDFDSMKNVLESQGKVNYQPGAFFTFEGMPAGLTPEQINEAWQRVQGLMKQIEQRSTALDLRETELRELAEDISRRQKELAQESLAVESMQTALNAKIDKFAETVRLVRDNEVQKLKQTAASLAAFDATKAAEIIQAQWQTERGMDRVLRIFEVMDKDAVNEILATLPTGMVQDVLEKRMQVSREAAAPGGRK